MAEESLHEGSEKPLHKAVKVWPGLHWRLQDIRGARAMGYLPWRAVYKEWDQPKRGKRVAVCRAGRAEPAKRFDIRHGATGLES